MTDDFTRDVSTEQKLLKAQHRHMMRLAMREADADGWAKVSAPIMRVICDQFDSQIVEFLQNEDGSGMMRVTPLGRIVFGYVTASVHYALQKET